MKIFISTACVLTLVGCASSSENVSATYVSPLEYESYNCDQISNELGRVSRRVHEVSGAQDDVASDDAVAMGVGLILFWPALFFIAGDDHADELGRLKGEYEALEKVAIEKECDISKQLEEARLRREQEEAARKAAREAASQTPGQGMTSRPSQ